MLRVGVSVLILIATSKLAPGLMVCTEGTTLMVAFAATAFEVETVAAEVFGVVLKLGAVEGGVLPQPVTSILITPIDKRAEATKRFAREILFFNFLFPF